MRVRISSFNRLSRARRAGAERLGVHQTRVQALIKAGRLPAQRYANVLLVSEKDLKLVADRKPGRPPSKVRARRK